MRIWVVGGASDIGCAIARRRISLGDDVVITCSSSKRLEETQAAFAKDGVVVDGFVYNFDDPRRSQNELTSHLSKGIDGTILNACERVFKLRRFHEHEYVDFKTYIDRQLHGSLWILHQVLPQMVKANFGRLVFISSLSSSGGTSRYPGYCLVKAALEGLFFNVAVDYGSFNILANIVRPGFIATERTRHFWRREHWSKAVSSLIPQQMLGKPEQVAEGIDPLLSPSSYMNGSTVTISGGLPLTRSEGVMAR